MSFHPQVQAPQPKLQIGSGSTPFKSAGFLPKQLPQPLGAPGGGAGTQTMPGGQFGGTTRPFSMGAPSQPFFNGGQFNSFRPGPAAGGFNMGGGNRPGVAPPQRYGPNDRPTFDFLGTGRPAPDFENTSGPGKAGIQRTGNLITGISATGQSANPFTNPDLFSAQQLEDLNTGKLMLSGRFGPTSIAGQLDDIISSGRGAPADPTAGIDPKALTDFGQQFNSPGGIGSSAATGSIQNMDPQQVRQILEVLQSLMQQGAV